MTVSTFDLSPLWVHMVKKKQTKKKQNKKKMSKKNPVMLGDKVLEEGIVFPGNSFQTGSYI